MASSSLVARGAGRGNGGWPFPDLVVEVAGELACFTRPELKVERVSYPVMTPSAAVGVLESIFWKPEFRYVVRKIEVLKPIEWVPVRRNEVKTAVSPTEVSRLRKEPGRRFDVEQDRDQRQSMLLRDVAYRIHTQLEPAAHARQVPPAKYRDQLRRRVERGACFSEPFLGCREFTCRFGPASEATPIGRDEEFGLMLHSIVYARGGGERYRWFRAQMRQGVVEVPEAALEADGGPETGGWWRSSARDGE